MSKFRHYEKKRTPLPRSVWENPIHFITCGFGVGCIPYFPGSFGTLLAVPLILFLAHVSLYTYITTCILLFVAGVFLCHKTNRDFQTDDHPATVFDEFATFPITLLGMPITWQWLLTAFLLFRFFDILKPWPISWADKNIHGGFGVMFDDFLAAIFSLCLLHIVLYFF